MECSLYSVVMFRLKSKRIPSAASAVRSPAPALIAKLELSRLQYLQVMVTVGGPIAYIICKHKCSPAIVRLWRQ